jgi:ATP-dependent Lon protease
MGLSYKLLTKKEFDSRLRKLSKGREYLKNVGSSINIYPGWLGILEQVLDSVDALSSGSVNFFFTSSRGNGNFSEKISIHVDTDLPPDSGRLEAMRFQIDRLTGESESVCRYCGVPLIGQKGVCEMHSTIAEGLFEGQVKYKAEITNDRLEHEPVEAYDIIEHAINMISILTSALGIDGYEPIEEYERFILRARVGSVTGKIFHMKKTVLQGQIEEIISKSKWQDLNTETKPAEGVIEAGAGVSRPTIQLFNKTDLEIMWEKSQGRERKPNIEPYYKKMKLSGPERKFATVSETWRIELDDLAEDFPNFESAGVIDYFRQQFALSSRGDGRVHIPPILLNGVSGIGKTYLAQALAKLVNTSYVEIHIENEQNGSALAGSSAFWSNAVPGKVFDVLAMNDYANPIVVVDEVDKPSKGSYDPLGGLYSLLEPVTAKTFSDLCAGFPIDASHICWIMTCNESDKLPVPILSRLRLFDVPAPTKEQTIHIAKRIYINLLGSHWGRSFNDVLSDEVTGYMGERAPREIRNALLSALGNAALDERQDLELKDFVGVGQVKKFGDYQGSKIGFGVKG